MLMGKYGTTLNEEAVLAVYIDFFQWGRFYG